MLALIPNIAEWAKTQIDGTLAAAGTSVAQVGLGKLAGTGVLYCGLESLGGGSVLAGMVLGADRGVHHRQQADDTPPRGRSPARSSRSSG